ncbi:hypothetical protein LCGC14_1954400 [marine sediment metagenome]|uniref:Uncharacterized protein n=1 Tax=marine sediment metagenome TaxID=412755 RepID=A0A0F9G4U0_9ZZZZ
MKIKVEDTSANTRRHCMACYESFKPWNIQGVLYDTANEEVGPVCEGCMNASSEEILARLLALADKFQNWANECRTLASEGMEAPPLEEFKKAVADDEVATITDLLRSPNLAPDERQRYERELAASS